MIVVTQLISLIIVKHYNLDDNLKNFQSKSLICPHSYRKIYSSKSKHFECKLHVLIDTLIHEYQLSQLFFLYFFSDCILIAQYATFYFTGGISVQKFRNKEN